jgi:hypothetical protein
MIKLTKDSVLKALDEVIAEYGEDYVYQQSNDSDTPSCLYAKLSEDGEAVPDCIVGHILAKHGVDMGPMVYDKRTLTGRELSTGQAYSVLSHMAHAGLVKYDGSVSKALTGGQSLQDHGATWGEAAKDIRATLNNYSL